MSSARNHAKRSHRSHHAVRTNTNHSIRKTVIRNNNKPKRTFFGRLFSRLNRRSRDSEGRV